MANKRFNDREFQKLAVRIKHAILENEGQIGDQKDQVERLIELERKFRNDICKYSRSTEMYRLFIDYISNDVGNILSAQSYFREKSTLFNKKISPAIKSKNSQELMKFDINYQLIQFIVDNWTCLECDGEGTVPSEDDFGNYEEEECGKCKGDGCGLPERSKKYYKDLVETRNILIENNLPLAINRAKIFYKKTPKSHLGLLDLIDICVYGLIVGVDKYADDYSTVWRSVSIGRMVGFMIEEYSKSFIRLYPSDKKILYRANSLKHRLSIDNIAELTEAVNESFERDRENGKSIPKLPITEVQIRTLMNSSTYVSADSKINDEGDDDEGGVCIYDYTPHPESVEDTVEKQDTMNKVLEATSDLEVLERKVIRLKGVEL